MTELLSFIKKAGLGNIAGQPYDHTVLKQGRVLLRPPQSGDEQEWITVRSRNREYLKPYEPTWSERSLTPDYFQRRLSVQKKSWNADSYYSFLIFKNTAQDSLGDNQDNNQGDNKDQPINKGVLIGGMNINNVCRGISQFASLGYWIDQDHEGQGYMAEALGVTLQFCFERIKLHRVHASCILKNNRSKSLLLRAGFTEEGLARKYLKINGLWQDHYLFGYCAEDWKEARKKQIDMKS